MKTPHVEDDSCPDTASGEHEPDWLSVSVDRDAPAGVIDVACRHCGRSGSFTVKVEDILW